MKIRFDKAVMKLYTAFHEGKLDAMDCEHCAVGNLCGNSADWVGEWVLIGSKGRVKADEFNTGYSNDELTVIERVFLYGSRNYGEPHLFNNNIPNDYVERGFKTKEQQKDLQFKGLCEVVKYLAELDGVENPMEIMHLFKNKELVL